MLSGSVASRGVRPPPAGEPDGREGAEPAHLHVREVRLPRVLLRQDGECRPVVAVELPAVGRAVGVAEACGSWGSLIRSLTRILICSFVRLFVCLFFPLCVRSFVQLFIHLFIHSFRCVLLDWLID